MVQVVHMVWVEMTNAQPKKIDGVETFLTLPEKTITAKFKHKKSSLFTQNCGRDYSSLSIIVQCIRNACRTTQLMKGCGKEEPRRKWNRGQHENSLTPWSPNINMQITLFVLYMFRTGLTGRICFKIKTFYHWWPIP